MTFLLPKRNRLKLDFSLCVAKASVQLVAIGSAVILPVMNAEPVHAQATVENTASAFLNGSTTRCSNNSFLIRSFNVSGSDRVGNITLGLTLQHSYRGAIAGFLQSPSGTIIQFLGINGSDTNDNYDVLFQDGGGALNDGTNDNIAAPFYDRSVGPNSALSAFAGEDANGAWNMYLCDGGTNITGIYRRSRLTISPISISGFAFDDTNGTQSKDANEGTLSNIGITVYRDDGDGTYEPGTEDAFVAAGQTNNAGEYAFGGLSSGDYWIVADETDPDLAGRTYGGTAASGTANPRLISYSGASAVTADFPFFQDLAVLCEPSDPLGNLSFLEGATLESGSNLQVGAVYRFTDVFADVDALITIAAYNGGATLTALDNDSTGVTAAFQPVLSAVASATSSVDFEISFVEKGTTVPIALNFKAFGVDIDGDGNALREFIELTNLDSFSLSGDTTLIATAIASGYRFESNTTVAQPGVSATVDSTRATTRYVSTSQLRYRIGAIAGAGSATQRLNSLYFGCTSGPVSSAGPDLLLTKRMTAINPGLGDEQLFAASFVDTGTPDDDDNAINWPGPPIAATIGSGTVESYIAGLTDGTLDDTTIRPNSELEYTISFLSNGSAAAQDVRICDRIPTNTTFVVDAYNNMTPASGSGGNRGMLLNFDGSEVALTNVDDGDEIPDSGGNDSGIGGYYFPAGVEPSTVFSDISCNGSNSNGAIVVDLSDMPSATGEGIPTNSFGFVRFKVRID